MIKWLREESKRTGVDPSGIVLLTVVVIGAIMGLSLFLYGITKQYLGW